MARRLPKQVKDGPHIRLDVNFCDDEKVVAAGEKAGWLLLAMALECRRRRSDGVLSHHLVSRLGVAGWQARLASLESYGLVEKTPTGWLIPSYLKWNKCESQYLRDRHNGRVGGCVRNHSQPCELSDCVDSRAWLESHPQE